MNTILVLLYYKNSKHISVYSTKQLKPFLPSPIVYDGSIINIGIKNDTEPINRTELAKEIASIIADFTQIALTLVILYNTTSGG